MQRISSIDITRGIVMVIMALDHVRDMIHEHSLTVDPTDLENTTPLLFFTRFITHLCAPVFVFLAGTSAYIAYRNANDVTKSRQFLLKRGFWLILLEFTIVNFALFFDIRFYTLSSKSSGQSGLGLFSSPCYSPSHRTSLASLESSLSAVIISYH